MQPPTDEQIPLIAIEGTARECGRRYVEVVMEQYSHYTRYLDALSEWKSTPGNVWNLFERHAPYIPDLLAGMMDKYTPQSNIHRFKGRQGCTSFAVDGSCTATGHPISGQTKDTAIESISLYIVLRMTIHQGPTMLVLAYPGEILGYGMWSTGMSLFRNNLDSRSGAPNGLTMPQWGLLALAGTTVDEGIDLAKRYGIRDNGNCLIADGDGQSASIEFNGGGTSVITPQKGILVHANHPVGDATAPHGKPVNQAEGYCSCHRHERLTQLLELERGLLTPQKAIMCLADHDNYPYSICRHAAGVDTSACPVTTATVVAESAKGCLHVVCGNPCSHWPATYVL